MVIVLAAEDVNVERDPGSDGERVEDVREHLCREVPDLLALQPEVRYAVWPRANIDNSAGQCLRMRST